MKAQSDSHVIWHEVQVTRQNRNRLNNHKSELVWFTALSASGKSTIAHGVEKVLFERGYAHMFLTATTYDMALTLISASARRTGRRT